MPIYEYQCGHCGEIFEAIQKFSDAPLTECRKCGASGEVRKLMSAPAFRLKGSGWYETDFKKDGKRNLARGDSEAGKSGGEKSSAGDGKSSTTSTSDGAGKSSSSSGSSKSSSGSGSGSGSGSSSGSGSASAA